MPLTPRREAAATILKSVPQTVEGIRSDKEPERFFQLTGRRHDEMKASWRANMTTKVLLTACNGFASWYAGQMGITGIDSFFDLDKSLFKENKAHAWVLASGGAKPQVGDILRHTVYHVDVAAGWKGNKLVRVAAGQSLHPRPTKNVESEFDALKWVTGTADYNPANLQGWLDLDLFFADAPTTNVSQAWLRGWWKVWDGNTYYYYFGNCDVQYTKTAPAGSGPPAKPVNRGTYTWDFGKLVITWALVGAVPTIETFDNAIMGTRHMNGRSNKYSPLVATRI